MQTKELDKLIEDFQNDIPIIPSEQNYWLLRANGGKYYEDFLRDSYIAVETFNIPLQEFIESDSLITATEKDYADIITNYLIRERHNVNYSSKQIFNFINNIKEKDLVLTPSKRSEYYLVGYAGELYEEEFTSSRPEMILRGSTKEIPTSPYRLRRKITWLKEVHRNEIDNSFLRILHTHQALINVNQYAHILDRLIFAFYIKENKFYANFYAQGTVNFSLTTWNKYHNTLFKRIGEKNADKFFLKQNIQSPGPIEIISNIKEFIEPLIPWASAAICMLGLKTLQIKYKDTEIKGTLPWLFARKRINKAMDLENHSKELDNELKMLEIEKIKKELNQPSVAEQVPEMRITINDAGRYVLPSTQMQRDSSDLQDEAEPEEQTQ